MYPNMRNFTAPYVFHEYPKWVTLADGSGLVVNSREEEDAAVGNEAADKTSVDSLRDALMAEAKALGLNPHHKTGIEKLKQIIQEHQS